MQTKTLYLFKKDNGNGYNLYLWDNKKMYMQIVKGYKKDTTIKQVNDEIKNALSKNEKAKLILNI